MSFFKSLKSAFGFGSSEPMEDDRLLNDDNSSAQGQPDTESEPGAAAAPAPEAPALDPQAVKGIFSSVIKVFNESLPPFIRESVDRKAQEEFLYRSLEQSAKDYLTRLIDEAQVYAENAMRHSNHETMAELARLRQEKQNLEQQRSSIKEQQLSADRRRRAMADRVQDLEAQVASLEAEREQFDLENKSLLNKIKLSEIQPAVVEELTAEVESLRAQLADGGPAPSGDLTIKLKDSEAKIAALEAALAARDEAQRTSAEMLNSMQHELVEERRKASDASEKAKAELESAMAAIAAKDSALDEKEAQLEEASRLLKGMEQLSAQMQQVETAINKRDDKIRSLQQKNRELKQRLEKAEKRAGQLMPTLPFDESGTAEAPAGYGDSMISTSPIRPEDLGEDDFHSVDWLTSTPPKGTIVRSELTDEEFGYQEPPRKPRPKDQDSQLSLF